MTLYGTSVLVTDKPVRGRMVQSSIPVLSFVPILDGVFDIQPAGTPVSQAAWLRQLAEAASELAIQVERNAALRTPEEWCSLRGLAVMDPDGWRGRGGRPWTDAITEDEFKDRFRTCTIRYDEAARAYLGEGVTA